jgi:Pyridoxal-phosphate dependent enzyme
MKNDVITLRLDKFERYPLTFGPTPIEYLPRMTEALGGSVHIYARRDDCNSGPAMGGNKLRKLEYIVPDAIASNADTLVLIGGVQSNHIRMAAATAAKIGMKCVVVQESWVPPRGRLVRSGRQHSVDPPDGRRQPDRPGWIRYRHPQELGRRDPIGERWAPTIGVGNQFHSTLQAVR